MSLRVFLLAVVAVLSGLIGPLSPLAASETTTDPAAVIISTSDISNFWRAYERAKSSPNPASVYATEYFARGTPGLRGFIPNRLRSPVYLQSVVQRYDDYYRAAGPNMRRIVSERPAIVADLRRYKKVYPKVVFPSLYFVVGTLNSGGTSVPNVGLIFGAEILSAPADLEAIPMGTFNKKTLSRIDRIPSIVAHELTHFNQHDAEGQSLLDQTLIEGSADFMAQLVDGDNIEEAQWVFGCAHEDELWKALAEQMGSTDEKVVESWLYSRDPGPLGAPPFIGYWLGSRIVQSYYDAQPDKQAAVDAILHITDYHAFLRASGYPASRPACVPERRLSD